MNTAQLPQLLALLSERINGRPGRERALMLGALLVLVFGVANSLFLGPALAHFARAGQGERDMALALDQARLALNEREQQARASAGNLKAELASWRERVQQSEAQFKAQGSHLMPASAMPSMLDALLRRHQALTLLGLRSLSPTELPGTAGPAPIYRQGMQLVLAGRYADLLGYCRALEALPQGLLWGDLQLAVESYPRVVLTLDVYTLSQDKPWLKL